MLVKSLPPVGAYVIAMDNYYGSVEAAQMIRAKGHHIVATVRDNRPGYLYIDILGDVVKTKTKQNQEERQRMK